MRTGRRHFFLAYISPEFVLEIERITGLGEFWRVVDMGGSEQRLLDYLFGGCRNYSLLRLKDEGLYDRHVRAAA
jgi:hypothetical protein